MGLEVKLVCDVDDPKDAAYDICYNYRSHRQIRYFMEGPGSIEECSTMLSKIWDKAFKKGWLQYGGKVVCPVCKIPVEDKKV